MLAVCAVVAVSCTTGDRDGDRTPSATGAARRGAPDELRIGTAAMEMQHETKLTAPPLGITFRDEDDGYIAIGSGTIDHFTLDDEGVITRREVASGLSQPRDVEYHDGRLFVTDVRLPCKKVARFDLARCAVDQFPGMERRDAEAKILKESKARVIAYDVGPDGDLGTMKGIIDDVPSPNSDHSLNGLAVGREGDLYASVGNVDTLHRYPDLFASVERANKELLGTVIRFRPDGSNMRVFARGIRNVYHLTFDDDGRLYGVDNDGPTQKGWREEELIRFEEGKHYGYPDEGSLGPFEIRTGQALWLMNGYGSAGIEWAPRAGLPRGLLVGSCGKLSAVLYDGERPAGRESERDVSAWPGCITVLRATPDKRLVVGGPNPHSLVVYELSG